MTSDCCLPISRPGDDKTMGVAAGIVGLLDGGVPW